MSELIGSPAVVVPCEEGHPPLTAVEAVVLLRSLYAVGVGYHHLADLTRLGLNHHEMAEILRLVKLTDQARLLQVYTS